MESDEEEREMRRKRRPPSVTRPPTAKRHKVSYQQVKTLQSSLKKVETTPEQQSLPASVSPCRPPVCVEGRYNVLTWHCLFVHAEKQD